MPIRHLLAPTDFSDASQQAVVYAFGLAQACRTQVSPASCGSQSHWELLILYGTLEHNMLEALTS